MTLSLTRRQADCLAFLREFIAERGFAPSLDEIIEALDLASKSGAFRLLGGLEERGHIRRIPSKARAIELIPTATSFDLTTLSPADLKVLAGRLDAELQRRCL